MHDIHNKCEFPRTNLTAISWKYHGVISMNLQMCNG